jgi:hypothetical protein
MIRDILWAGAGAIVGGLSFLNLQWTVVHLSPGKAAASAWPALGGMLLRWSAAAVLLLAALRMGGDCGLAAFCGYMLAGRLLLARGIGRV